MTRAFCAGLPKTPQRLWAWKDIGSAFILCGASPVEGQAALFILWIPSVTWVILKARKSFKTCIVECLHYRDALELVCRPGKILITSPPPRPPLKPFSSLQRRHAAMPKVCLAWCPCCFSPPVANNNPRLVELHWGLHQQCGGALAWRILSLVAGVFWSLPAPILK